MDNNESVHTSMKKTLTILILFLLSLSATAGIRNWFKEPEAWNADNIEMVHLRDSNKWVCNPDKVIKQETCDSIDFWCKKLNAKGVESVIVIVKKVQDEDCFRMAQDIGNKYGVGDKETRRGLVIVVAYKQHKYFIATGQGLEQDLTDADCNRIAERFLKPAMKDENPDKAMLNTVKAIHNKLDWGIAELYKGQQAHDEEVETIVIVVVIIIIILFILVCIATKGEALEIFFGGSSFGSGGGGGWSGGSFGGGSFGGGGAGGSW